MIIGGSENGVNDVVAAIFKKLEPTGLFNGTIPIGQSSIVSVDFHITSPPELLFREEAPLTQSHTKDDTGAIHGVEDQAVAFSSSVYEIKFGFIDFTLHYDRDESSPIQLQAQLSIAALLQWSTPQLTVRAVKGSAKTNKSSMDSTIDEIVVPNFIDYLNKHLLPSFEKPTFTSLPTSDIYPVLQTRPLYAGYLATYIGRADERPTIIPNLATLLSEKGIDGFFVAVDSSFINRACDAAFTLAQPYRTTFAKEDLNGSCEVRLIRTSFILEHDRSLKGDISFKANFQLNFDRSESPHPSFESRAEGQMFEVKAETTISDRLRVATFNTEGASVSSKIVFDDHPPMQDLQNYLNDEVLSPAIKKFLNDLSCVVLDNPRIHLLVGSGFDIVLQVTRRWVINENTHQPLLVAFGKPELT